MESDFRSAFLRIADLIIDTYGEGEEYREDLFAIGRTLGFTDEDLEDALQDSEDSEQ